MRYRRMPDARIASQRIHYRLVDGCAVVRPEGACNEEGAEALARLVGSPMIESKNLVLDLSHTEYVESPGFRWLVRQIRKLDASGKRMVVAGLPPSVERAFKLLRLDSMVPVARNVAEALDMLSCSREFAAASN